MADDGHAVLLAGHVDLGTGIATAYAQVVAEELDWPLDRVHPVLGDTARAPNQGPTIASTSLQLHAQPLRLAAAQARAWLLARAAAQWGLDAATLQRRLETDGPLAPEYWRTELVGMLQREVWGQGFAPPVFSEEVEVLSQRLVGEKHLALKLKHQGQPVDGIWINRTEPLPARARLAFRLDADEWQGQKRVRFLIEAAEV